MVVYELPKLLFKFWMIFDNKYLWGIKRPEATVATFFYFVWSCCICFNSSGVLILSANAALSFFILDGIITWQ